MPVPFHVGLLPNRPAAQVAELIVEAEALGFAGAWVADSQSIFRDAYTVLSVAATRTATIELATGVTNPLTRHPAVLAGAFATLDELSGGRATLGMGVGESAVHTIGMRPAKLATMEHVTAAVRALVRGGHVDHDGADLHLPWAAREVPVVFASSGPRSLGLSGRMADGVLFQAGALPELTRYALDHVADGAREAGRDPSAIRRLCRLACSVAHDRDWAREQVEGYAAVAAGTTFASVPADVIPPELGEDIRRMKEAYDYMEHASQDARHRTLVTPRIVDAMSVAGTPEEVVPRLQAIVDMGADGFVLPMTSPDPGATMRLLAAAVIPHVRAPQPA